MKAGSVERLHTTPKPLDRLGRDTAWARVRLFAADGYGLEIGGQVAESAEWPEGLLHLGPTLAPTGRGCQVDCGSRVARGSTRENSLRTQCVPMPTDVDDLLDWSSCRTIDVSVR